MCGLAGVAGNTNVKIREAFLDLLLITQLRGRDSTGIFTVQGDDATMFCKEVGPPDNLFDRKSFDDTLRGVPKVMAGHCRSKTIGDNNRLNAHPYDFDDVIGMHNGTLRMYHQMEGYDYKRTDSHALFYNFDKFGVEETVRKLDPDGAYALVWWDKVDNRLNFLRNEKRPLWFAWTKDKTTVFWCSEPWMFSAVARHVDLWDGTDEGKEPVSPYVQLPTNTLWSFTVNAYTKPGEKHLTFHQPREITAEGKKSVGFSIGSGNGGEVANPFRADSEGVYQRLQARVATRNAQGPDMLKLLGHARGPLDDSIADLNPEESTTTTPSAEESKKTSSNVLDFRAASNLGTNTGKKKLSLVKENSPVSPLSNNGSGTDGSNGSCGKPDSLPSSQDFPRVSLRDVIGTTYITHNDTGNEITQQEFEARTGGNCSFCKTPIGDLTEVAAFTNKAMAGFICNSCLIEPKVAVTG